MLFCLQVVSRRKKKRKNARGGVADDDDDADGGVQPLETGWAALAKWQHGSSRVADIPSPASGTTTPTGSVSSQAVPPARLLDEDASAGNSSTSAQSGVATGLTSILQANAPTTPSVANTVAIPDGPPASRVRGPALSPLQAVDVGKGGLTHMSSKAHTGSLNTCLPNVRCVCVESFHIFRSYTSPYCHDLVYLRYMSLSEVVVAKGGQSYAIPIRLSTSTGTRHSMDLNSILGLMPYHEEHSRHSSTTRLSGVVEDQTSIMLVILPYPVLKHFSTYLKEWHMGVGVALHV